MSIEVPTLLLPKVTEIQVTTQAKPPIFPAAEPHSVSDPPKTTADASQPLSILIPKRDKGKQRATSPSADHIASNTRVGKRRARSPSGPGPSRKIRVVSGPHNTIIKSEEPQVTFMNVDTHISGVDKRTQRRIRYQDIENDETDEEEAGKEDEVDEVGDDDSSSKVKYTRPPITHKGVIPAAGTKLRADLLTCDRCWSKNVLCVRQQGGQACKACRTVRMKCSRVIPSCPRRRNLTEEDELLWRVQGIEPPSASAARARSRSHIQRKAASSEHSTRTPKRNIAVRHHVKAKEEDDEDEESEQDVDQQRSNRVDDRRPPPKREVSWTRSGRVVGFGKNPPSRSGSSWQSDQQDNTRATRLEGRMSRIEIAMKESATTQKQLAQSMKSMSSALLKMSSEIVRSSSIRSSSDPEMARQLRQLSARSHAITQAIDNQGLALLRDEKDDDPSGPSLRGKQIVTEEIPAIHTYRNIRLQATPLTFEKAVQAGGDKEEPTITSKIPDTSFAYESIAFRSPVRPSLYRHSSVPLPATSSSGDHASYSVFSPDLFQGAQGTLIKDHIMANPWLEDEVPGLTEQKESLSKPKEGSPDDIMVLDEQLERETLSKHSACIMGQDIHMVDVNEEQETPAASSRVNEENENNEEVEEFHAVRGHVPGSQDMVGSMENAGHSDDAGSRDVACSGNNAESGDIVRRAEIAGNGNMAESGEIAGSRDPVRSGDIARIVHIARSGDIGGSCNLTKIGNIGESDDLEGNNHRPATGASWEDNTGRRDVAGSRNTAGCWDVPIGSNTSKDVNTSNELAGSEHFPIARDIAGSEDINALGQESQPDNKPEGAERENNEGKLTSGKADGGQFYVIG